MLSPGFHQYCDLQMAAGLFGKSASLGDYEKLLKYSGCIKTGERTPVILKPSITGSRRVCSSGERGGGTHRKGAPSDRPGTRAGAPANVIPI